MNQSLDSILEQKLFINNNIFRGEDLLRQGITAVHHKGKPWLIEEETLDIGRISPTGTPGIRLRVKDAVELEPRSISLVTAEQDQPDGLILLDGQADTEPGALCETRNKEVTLPIFNADSKKIKLAKRRVLARGVMVNDENFFKLKEKASVV